MAKVEEFMSTAMGQGRASEDPLTERVTCRLDAEAHYMLKSMATRLNMSKSGLAEKIIDRAIVDAWEVYLSNLDEGNRIIEEEKYDRFCGDCELEREYLEGAGGVR